MGISTDAILAYGYDLGDDIEIEHEEDESKGEVLERRLLERLVGFTDVWTKEDKTYFERERAAKKEMGLEIIYHCSEDYPMYFLASRGSEIRANRGYPVKINPLDINDNHDHWNAKLKEGMEALDIEPKDEPGYHLFSMWG